MRNGQQAETEGNSEEVSSTHNAKLVSAYFSPLVSFKASSNKTLFINF
jgi:hypothetical protein